MCTTVLNYRVLETYYLSKMTWMPRHSVHLVWDVVSSTRVLASVSLRLLKMVLSVLWLLNYFFREYYTGDIDEGNFRNWQEIWMINPLFSFDSRHREHGHARGVGYMSHVCWRNVMLILHINLINVGNLSYTCFFPFLRQLTFLPFIFFHPFWCI